jgi:hypothetical protein
MGTALYVERETCPSLIRGEEVMVHSRVKGTPGAPPRFFVAALEPNTQFELRTGQGHDVLNFPVTSTSAVLDRGRRVSVDLAAAVTADHTIYVLRCLSGRLAVTIVSPHEVQMQFRSLRHR